MQEYNKILAKQPRNGTRRADEENLKKKEKDLQEAKSKLTKLRMDRIKMEIMYFWKI